MKRHAHTIMIVTAALLLLSASALSAATTATQNIEFNLTESYTGIAAVRVFDGATVNPTITFTDEYTGQWEVTDAGAQAVKTHYGDLGEFAALDAKSGGSLQYTVANLTNQKITVHVADTDYNSDSLKLAVTAPQDNTGTDTWDAVGSTGTYLGEIVGTGTLTIAQGSGTARNVLVGIPGGKYQSTIDGSHTGTAGTYDAGVNKVPGAPITYSFQNDPGISVIPVTYTITPDDTETIVPVE